MEKITAFERRKNRVRFAIKQKGAGRIRLCINRSERHIEAQLIDDRKAITLASASSKEKDFKAKGSSVEGAKLVGSIVAIVAFGVLAFVWNVHQKLLGVITDSGFVQTLR